MIRLLLLPVAVGFLCCCSVAFSPAADNVV